MHVSVSGRSSRASAGYHLWLSGSPAGPEPAELCAGSASSGMRERRRVCSRNKFSKSSKGADNKDSSQEPLCTLVRNHTMRDIGMNL